MTTHDYKERMEEQLVQKFRDEFFQKIGYYPTVITNNKETLVTTSLEDLEDYFEPFLPFQHGVKVKLEAFNRIRSLVELRNIFCHIAREMGYTLREIGQHLNKRDHTTVIHNIKTFDSLNNTDDRFKGIYLTILNNIKNNNYESPIMEPIDQMENQS